jgi:hypothetical protein
MKLEVVKNLDGDTACITLTDVAASETTSLVELLTDKVLGIEKPVAPSCLDVANQCAETHANWKEIVRHKASEMKALGQYNKIMLVKFLRHTVPGMDLKDAVNLVNYAEGHGAICPPTWFKFS